MLISPQLLLLHYMTTFYFNPKNNQYLIVLNLHFFVFETGSLTHIHTYILMSKSRFQWMCSVFEEAWDAHFLAEEIKMLLHFLVFIRL